MPNTLVHLGVQGLASRALFRNAAVKWILLGCTLPDLPWIFQRIIRQLFPVVNPYDLRLYAIVQASLAVSLLLCGALALLSRRPVMVFSILASNCLLHLLLDACETKWGNGVHLLAPYSWKLVNFGFFWPESLPVYSLTVFGLVTAVWMLYREPVGTAPVHPDLSAPRILLSAVLLGAYFLLPLQLLHGPEVYDNHSVATLRNTEDRDGRAVAADRYRYIHHDTGDRIRTFTGEELRVAGNPGMQTGTVSFRGNFSGADTLVIGQLHYHQAWFRDGASCIGLLLVLAAWVRELRVTHRFSGWLMRRR